MRTWTVLLAALLIPAVSAEETPLPPAPLEELFKLHSSGVGDEVLLAWLEAQAPFAALDIAAVKRLRDAKVPEAVTQTLIQRGGQRPSDAVSFLRVYQVTQLSMPERSKSLLTEADYEGLEHLGVARVLETSRYVYRDVYLRSRPNVLDAYPFPYSRYRALPYAASPYYYPRHNYLYGAYRYPYYSAQSCAFEYPHYQYYYGDRYYYRFGNVPCGGYRMGGVRLGPTGSPRR